ncbi:hypothetical protein CU560_17340 [Serratia ureilytica]|nr:hypothetical protein CU560_17340 [Serratia ureilytica]
MTVLRRFFAHSHKTFLGFANGVNAQAVTLAKLARMQGNPFTGHAGFSTGQITHHLQSSACI